ncbi:DMT family transporter [Anaerobacillus sp. CMMVII]|uniref:DMT family transporter n=1 Tax=Anaerobacillus sp. CMMVII TaxID=2755588 RepID=UPI0021B80AF8|nr:DMT family transporter [Anaerobacillus sp. CMMVII]
MVQEVSFENTSFLGAFWGIVSAFTFSLLAIINRVLVRGYSSIVVGFYQNSFGFIVLIPFLFLFPFQFQFQLDNFLLLVLLGVLFTGVSHVMFIQGLKSVNVQKASIIACLEPVYGIIAAVFILAEIPSLREGVGILIILCMAIYVSFYSTVE